jgi:hypothetical protein
LLGADWIELELCCLLTTSFSSEQPSSSQAPFSSLRSSSIDSPFTSRFAPLIRERGCVPFIRFFAVKVKKKMHHPILTQVVAPVISGVASLEKSSET